MLLEVLLADCSKLSGISSEAAEAYSGASDRLQILVNEQLETSPNIKELIGGNPLEMMQSNHCNHQH